MAVIINKRQVEGYWNTKDNDYPQYPMPVRHNKKWKKSEFLVHLKVVQNDLDGKTSQGFMKGWSTCRVCQAKCGSSEFARGKYDWPDGLVHYITKHGVKPSDDFIEFINAEYLKITKGE